MPEKIDINTLFITFLSGNATESEKDQVYSILRESKQACILLSEISRIWDATGIANDIVIETDNRFRKLLSKIHES
jgi:hypothetical protein